MDTLKGPLYFSWTGKWVAPQTVAPQPVAPHQRSVNINHHRSKSITNPRQVSGYQAPISVAPTVAAPYCRPPRDCWPPSKTNQTSITSH